MGLALIAGYLLWRLLFVWFCQPVTPDPWGPEVTEALESAEATPICPHCQTPHSSNRWFCSECGRAIGDYTNLLAPFYAYSIGDVLRDGITNGSSVSWPRRVATIVIGAFAYLIFAPLFLRHALCGLWTIIGDFVLVIVWPIGFVLFVRYLLVLLGVKFPEETDLTDSQTPPAAR